ncbi:gas vesicle protein [Pelotomaculum propionicicum]|uniref:Gas vesicle structural protein n=1 Tax=Pelotomaculum propionicicum TaxID=258475 RepID=A0A4Y7RNQ0_9FIRM|nr:gas vesicle protein [Pelotomaculum propionicicum]NLI13625.1 gas vesicle protein [Peptococcaceae bacterium]TEB09937.1 Gas vesicle structural protein [Pelotomaculum propionicicum]
MVSKGKQLYPSQRREVTLNDLLDRLLTKGLMLNSDVVVSVSGIPLLGLNLRLALGGMSTMLRYGFMTDWDDAIRSAAKKKRVEAGLHLEDGEKLLLSLFGSCWYSKGIYSAWRPGLIYLTDRRLLLCRQEPSETLLDINLWLISGIDNRQVKHFSDQNRQEVWLTMTSGDVVRLHCIDSERLLDTLKKAHALAGPKNINLPAPDIGEMIWHLTPGGKVNCAWQPGAFSVQDGGLRWLGHSRQSLSFRVFATDVLALEFVEEDIMSGPDGRAVLEMHYLGRTNPEKAYFAGDMNALRPWVLLLREARRDILETCPACGAPAPTVRLLNKGCAVCGWLSARLKRLLP